MKEIKSLLPFAKPFKWWIFLATICMALVTTMSLAGPWAIRSLIQTVTDQNPTDGFAKVGLLAILLIIIYIIRAISRFGTDFISHYAAWNILEDIRHYLFDHLQHLSLRFFNNNQTGDLMSRIINDTSNFETLLAHAIPTIVVNGIMFVGVTIILFTMNPRLALFTLIPVPFLTLVVLKFSKVSRPLFRRAQEKIGIVNAVLHDSFSGIKEIKAFTQEDRESIKTHKSLAEYTKAILKALRLSNAFHPGIELISSLGTVIVMFVGGRYALSNQLALEDLVAFLLYLNIFYQPITELGKINEGLQQALASSQRVLELIEQEPEVIDLPDAITLKDVKGKIEFQDISFQYIDKTPVLKNISFLLEPGKTLALVGATGVGKTTIANLIPRFYDADKGNILIDNHDIRTIALKNLRQQISIVSQDVFLFNGTIKENILYGSPYAKEKDIIAAAKAANAHDFITDLDNGYDTEVGERGVKLSGGQKQRVSIARAILKDAPILILDEATSAVDTQTEKLIQEAINKLKKNKTAIIIAHRLSTIKEADQIIVLQNGEILEKGNHETLYAEKGLYHKLCATQSTN